MDHRAIMSGTRKDMLAVVLRGALAGLSVPYRIGIAHRNRRYDQGSAEIHSCGVPVVSDRRDWKNADRLLPGEMVSRSGNQGGDR